jgi:hypothetical protein
LRCCVTAYRQQLTYSIRQLGNWAIGQLGNWAIGQLGNWATGQLGNWAIGQLGNWAIGQLGNWAIGYIGSCCVFAQYWTICILEMAVWPYSIYMYAYWTVLYAFLHTTLYYMHTWNGCMRIQHFKEMGKDNSIISSLCMVALLRHCLPPAARLFFHIP